MTEPLPSGRTTEDPNGDVFPVEQPKARKMQVPNMHIVDRYNAYASQEEISEPTAALLVIAEMIMNAGSPE